MIFYLHGFISSPASVKARQLKARMAERGLDEAYACPQLPVSARAAIALVEDLIVQAHTPVTLVGSSLGGYYATHLSEKLGLRAVLVNPAVLAADSLAAQLGRQTNMYTGESFEFTHTHIAEIQALDVPAPAHPERFWLLVEKGDEVLDYRRAVTRYAGARQTVLEGGDHSFTRWQEYLDAVIAYAGL